MILLWIIAGFSIGWIGIDLLFTGIFKVPVPILYNLILGFIGALTLYTYFYGG